jgi:CRISPR-associated protein Cas5h
MKSDKILIFDISGEYAHFRKYNTTTSPLTYSIPPRTAVSGLLGAIIGIDRFNYIEVFSKKNADIAVQVINPVKKVNMAFNLLDTKHSFFNIKNRTQIEFELIKDARYRIFFMMNNQELFKQITDNISNNIHHFSPYLGLSQFTAKIDFIDIKTGTENKSKEYIEIISALNLNYCDKNNPVKFDYNLKYSSNTMAISMILDEKRERTVTEYADVLIELEGKPILAKTHSYTEIKDFGNVMFL